MRWTDGVAIGTLVVALATFTVALANFLRDRVLWKVRGYVEPAKDGTLRLRIELTNPGRTAVTVEEVFLARRVNDPNRSEHLTDCSGHPTFPRSLEPGRKITIFSVDSVALEGVAVLQPVTIVAKAQDGRCVKTRCPRLRELYAELKTARANGASQRDW